MRRPFHPRAQSQLLLVALVITTRAGGALAETYLVLPLIGDHITIVSQENQVGAHLDKNRYEVVPQSDPNLDNAALAAVRSSLRKARPEATITLLRSTEPKLYALRDAWLDADAIDTREV